MRWIGKEKALEQANAPVLEPFLPLLRRHPTALGAPTTQ
jgi:hypothetical protein